MKKVKGDVCKNARIKIDYSKNKPQVTFSYPSKKYQTEFSLFTEILLFSFLLFFIITIVVVATGIIEKPELQQGGLNWSSINTSNYEEVKSFYSNNQDYYVNKTFMIFNYEYNFIEELKEAWETEVIRFFLIGSLVTLMFSCLIYFPFKKEWANFAPMYMAFKRRQKITYFKAKDVIKNGKEIYCELPVFNNIVLNYEATEDFSKYLEEFEIREHNFKYYYKKKFSDKEKKRKKELNEWIWYARFYFKEVPKKGFIKVIYC